jgi:hypothetical protein
MSSEFVVVATFHLQSQAETARMALNASGIEAFVQDSNMSTLLPWHGLRGIKVQVPAARADEARALLESSSGLLSENRQAQDSVPDDACLSCGQHMPSRAKRCPACGWSFLDQPTEPGEAGTLTDQESQEEPEPVPPRAAKVVERCHRCGSDKIIPLAKIVDQGQYSDGQLQAHVGYAKPEALIFKMSVFAKLNAAICGECGHTELTAVDPDELYAAYQATKNYERLHSDS